MTKPSWPPDSEAWAAWAAAVYSRVYGRLRRRGVAPGPAGERTGEAVQDAFVQGLRRPDFPQCFSTEQHAVNWLTLVAYRKALDELRRKKGHTLDEAGELAAPPPDGGPPSVWECVQLLPEPHRQVLVWYFYEGCTDAQIGVRLYPGGGTPAGLGQRARRVRLDALRQLRTLLLRHGVDPDDWDPRPGG